MILHPNDIVVHFLQFHPLPTISTHNDRRLGKHDFRTLGLRYRNSTGGGCGALIRCRIGVGRLAMTRRTCPAIGFMSAAACSHPAAGGRGRHQIGRYRRAGIHRPIFGDVALHAIDQRLGRRPEDAVPSCAASFHDGKQRQAERLRHRDRPPRPHLCKHYGFRGYAVSQLNAREDRFSTCRSLRCGRGTCFLWISATISNRRIDPKS